MAFRWDVKNNVERKWKAILFFFSIFFLFVQRICFFFRHLIIVTFVTWCHHPMVNCYLLVTWSKIVCILVCVELEVINGGIGSYLDWVILSWKKLKLFWVQIIWNYNFLGCSSLYYFRFELDKFKLLIFLTNQIDLGSNKFDESFRIRLILTAQLWSHYVKPQYHINC